VRRLSVTDYLNIGIAVKTREKILHTSLQLFNEEGESHVTTVDIANELDISPGNLYYHFKGKEITIENLFEKFEEGFSEILHAPINKELKIEDSWYYLYVVFEEMYHYRFIYQNLSDLLQRYEIINKRFRKLLNLKFQTGASIIAALREADILLMDDATAEVLINNIIMTITYWIAYSNLRDGKQSEQIMLHKGVFQVLSLIAPFLSQGKAEYHELCRQFYLQALAGDSIKP
jgi:AcrR family transcriptional regulator